ncbi:hypothetical protein [Adhaeretor mobilis]|uniref:Uncharacterized protein n=1 Tax=Adhaeretor mobilis TaxID=1930276 RepID=A0A517MXR7_9BACT|nr:hypothetical protein [Adhaeretor mobilis]QDS99674.1 hypothetical protein HG15A2_30010 [Adhaeretor mobilis]
MAAKENQGLQAIIIVLTLLVLGLLVSVFLVNNAKKTARAQADDLQTRNTESQRAQSQLQEEANNYKTWMGFSPEDSIDTLREPYTADMARYGENFAEEERNYRRILEQIENDYNKMASDESNAKDQVKDLKQQLRAVQAAANAQIEEYVKQLEEAKSDAASERVKFAEQDNQIKKEKEEIAAQLAAQRTEHDQQIASLRSQISELDGKIAKLDRANDRLLAERQSPDPFAEPADGKITWVNQRYSKAWINLGTADGLRPQVTFSVYSPNEADASKAVKKGSIEVLRVMEPHLAEVRITDDSNQDPVMPGDQIYSQVWNRGRQLGFAFTGFIDIDGDNKNDSALLKRIIQASNGEVDAAPAPYGNESGDIVDGEMDVATRYLILGDRSREGNQAESEHLSKAWDQMNEDADSLGVETIALDEFITLMGWRSDNRAVTLGPTARPDAFPAKPHTQELPRKRTQPTGTFRKRLPPTPF